MATKNIVPRATNEGNIGRADKKWIGGYFNNLIDLGKINFTDPTTLTIASGVVTITQSYNYIDTESSAASDDLNTISGGVTGDSLYICALNTARTVVLKHGTGNILTSDGLDISLDNTEKIVQLIFNGANWIVAGSAAGGAPGSSGYSGYSGLGLSGYSGYSGTNGSAGIPGSPGSSGYSGYSGAGTSGYSGYSGTRDIDVRPILFNLDTTDTGADYGTWTTVQTIDYSATVVGSAWGSFKMPLGWDVSKDINFDVVYNLNGLNNTKNISLTCAVWAFGENDKPNIASPTTTTTYVLSSGTAQNDMLHTLLEATSAFDIAAGSLTAGDTISIKFTRNATDAVNDTYTGTFQLISILAYQP